MTRPIPGWLVPILALIALPVSLPLLVYEVCRGRRLALKWS